ncbi:MAG TPA: phosphotransferase [Rhizobiaceae bacterium]|nr:phosphotransferase [Rhizobiaceae bacterium]
MTAIEEAIAKARALPCWKDPREIAPLPGGITNINLTVMDRGRKFVVRFGHDIAEHGITRSNEVAISRAAAEAGISPAVHHVEPGILVLAFVDAAPLTEADLHEVDTLLKVTALIRDAHEQITAHVRGPIHAFWVFHVLRDYAAFLSERSSPHCAELPRLMLEAANLERAVGKVDLVVGHNDLLPANILRGSERLWLVDWEYGGFNSPLFDLGGLATNCSLPLEAERLMLRTYFGAEPDAALLQSYGAMKCASLLRETLWSMVSELTSTIAFDYPAYTALNLDRYRRAFDAFEGCN